MNHSDIEHMAQGYPPSHIGKDCEEVITWLATQLLATQEQRDALAANEGYKQAFYEIADILGIGARPDSPKDVFERVIKPMLINLTKESGQLAAENVALKGFGDTLSEMHAGLEGSGTGFSGEHEAACQQMALDSAMDEFDAIKTPATAAYLNSVRAEGIHFAANRMLAAWESGFIDDTPAQVHDISGAVLSALEFLPNASPEEFKRDYADEVRSAIVNQLRGGKDGE